MFPSSNVWNRRVDSLPVAGDSAAMISAIGLGAHLHPDFGSYSGYGIPYNIVGTSTPRSTVKFQYASESDKVGYPIPAHPKIEGGSDRHLLMVDTNACKLYELYAAVKTSSGWKAGSGAVWNLRSNALRPNGWTSADAAGLPILPGLVRYDEVARGAILHALRFTAPSTCAGHIYPARHDAGSGSCSAEPPMGLRVRLKASVSLSGYGTQARILLTALKRYGMILADNGSPWYVTGSPRPALERRRAPRHRRARRVGLRGRRHERLRQRRLAPSSGGVDEAHAHGGPPSPGAPSPGRRQDGMKNGRAMPGRSDLSREPSVVRGSVAPEEGQRRDEAVGPR